MHFFIAYSTTKFLKPITSISETLSSISTIFSRSFSQSTSIPKKQQWIRDHGFDDYMEIEKRIRKVHKFQELLLRQPDKMLSVSRLDMLSRRLGFKEYEGGRFILKFPHVFEIFEHPVQRVSYCRLSSKCLLQMEQENQALLAQLPDAVFRLRKLLMMSNNGRLRLGHIRIACREFGLPDDFEQSIVLKHPEFFRLFDDDDETRTKYIEIIEKSPDLARCAIEIARENEYRTKGVDAEDNRFAFNLNFPPGFKTGEYHKIAMWKWQRVPYWSPYEDVSGYDLRSLEAQKKMEKRAVATVHELLSLTVEKKITMERIAPFRMAMDLPKKLKDFLLQHQGIFYLSTRGNHGRNHTVFLREAYRKGELIEPNDLYCARRMLAELILMSLRKAKVDTSLVTDRKDGEDHEVDGVKRHWDENGFEDFDASKKNGEEFGGSEVDSDSKSDDNDGSCSDMKVSCDESTDTKETQ